MIENQKDNVETPFQDLPEKDRTENEGKDNQEDAKEEQIQVEHVNTINTNTHRTNENHPEENVFIQGTGAVYTTDKGDNQLLKNDHSDIFNSETETNQRKTPLPKTEESFDNEDDVKAENNFRNTSFNKEEELEDAVNIEEQNKVKYPVEDLIREKRASRNKKSKRNTIGKFNILCNSIEVEIKNEFDNNILNLEEEDNRGSNKKKHNFPDNMNNYNNLYTMGNPNNYFG